MKALIFFVFVVVSSLGQAYTECPATTIDRIHVGDAGGVYIYLTGAGSVSIPPSNLNQQNALATALSAFAMNKRIIIRYAADGVSCSANLVDDFRGMWLLKD
jgi:hypothetical protein